MRCFCRTIAALTCLTTSALAQSNMRAVSPASPLIMGETFTIQSNTLDETRRINIYLPPVYKDSADVRLPVLYMPDGGMGEDFLHVAGLVQVSTGNGTMRPFVLVGIENTQRRRDTTGPTRVESDRKIAPQVGGSAAFRTFIRTELMPAVASRYRTTNETAIMGESLAGLFVVETLFLEPDLFDTYIAFDPSLWWNEQALVRSAGPRLAWWTAGAKQLYVATADYAETQVAIRELVTQLEIHHPPGVTWTYEPMPDEHHSTIFPTAALHGIRTLFAAPEAPP
jgi:predicted alpha/beta superfamily hydrolase